MSEKRSADRPFQACLRFDALRGLCTASRRGERAPPTKRARPSASSASSIGTRSMFRAGCAARSSGAQVRAACTTAAAAPDSSCAISTPAANRV